MWPDGAGMNGFQGELAPRVRWRQQFDHEIVCMLRLFAQQAVQSLDDFSGIALDAARRLAQESPLIAQ